MQQAQTAFCFSMMFSEFYIHHFLLIHSMFGLYYFLIIKSLSFPSLVCDVPILASKDFGAYLSFFLDGSLNYYQVSVVPCSKIFAYDGHFVWVILFLDNSLFLRLLDPLNAMMILQKKVSSYLHYYIVLISSMVYVLHSKSY